MKTSIVTTLLYSAAILLKGGTTVAGQYLRGDGDTEDVYQDTPITASNTLPEGHSAKCKDDIQLKVYRWTDHQLRWYPNRKIADSYDITWQKDVALLDCIGEQLTFGPDMPKRFRDGTVVACYADNDVKIYVMVHDKLRWVSSPDIADSYNIRWRKEAKYINCDLYEYGENAIKKMTHRLANDGNIVTCFGDERRVYRVEEGKLRWYPNPPIAYSWTQFWRPIIVVDCEIYHFGPDMPFHNPPAYVNH